MSMEPKRALTSNADLSAQTEMALMQSGQAQKQQFKQIRANAVKEAKSEHGKQTANWVKRQFNRLDEAFMEGFYQPSPTANSQRANDQTLDFDEWEDRDEDTLQEVRFQLGLVDDIVNAGFTVDSSLARTVYTRQRESAWTVEGKQSMDGRAESNTDEAALEIFGVPLPITHVDYEISAREQQQSQNFGEDLETRQARQAGHILRETEENQMLDGWDRTVTGPEGNTLSLNGYRDSNIHISGTVAGDWGTPSNILDTIDNFLNAVESQTTDNNRGPDPVDQGAWLYFHPNQRSDLRAADPRGDGNMSVRQRIEQDYPYLELASRGALNDGEVLMVVKDQRFAEAIVAQSPTNVSEEVEMGFATAFKTLSCRVPFFKKTYDGVKGIVRGTGA